MQREKAAQDGGGSVNTIGINPDLIDVTLPEAEQAKIASLLPQDHAFLGGEILTADQYG